MIHNTVLEASSTDDMVIILLIGLANKNKQSTSYSFSLIIIIWIHGENTIQDIKRRLSGFKWRLKGKRSVRSILAANLLRSIRTEVDRF